jgi:hypothetical protein
VVYGVDGRLLSLEVGPPGVRHAIGQPLATRTGRNIDEAPWAGVVRGGCRTGKGDQLIHGVSVDRKSRESSDRAAR